MERLIEEKRKGHEVTATAQPKTKAVVDIMDALRRSLENNTARAKPAPKKTTGKRARKVA